VPVVCYIYYGTVYDRQFFPGQSSSLFVFAQPPVKGQHITLDATGKRVVLTNVDHYQMRIDAVPVEP
jgi:hypothetical protein